MCKFGICIGLTGRYYDMNQIANTFKITYEKYEIRLKLLVNKLLYEYNKSGDHVFVCAISHWLSLF